MTSAVSRRRKRARLPWGPLARRPLLGLRTVQLSGSTSKSKKVNIGIFADSAVVFALALWLVRSQATVDDTEYMRAMIPHHSIAIMTSERSQITDPRVRKLADEIIAA